jgi:predicted nucleic acid-binding protein
MKAHLATAVVVAASVADHPHHSQSLGILQMVRKKAMIGHISGHGLSETYAVLTRTPFTPPIYPAEAWKLLSMNVLPYFQIVTLTALMYRETIQECADSGWIGGRIYDALHLCCAKKAACDRIYTLNVRHFQQSAPDLADRIGAP